MGQSNQGLAKPSVETSWHVPEGTAEKNHFFGVDLNAFVHEAAESPARTRRPSLLRFQILPPGAFIPFHLFDSRGGDPEGGPAALRLLDGPGRDETPEEAARPLRGVHVPHAAPQRPVRRHRPRSGGDGTLFGPRVQGQSIPSPNVWGGGSFQRSIQKDPAERTQLFPTLPEWARKEGFGKDLCTAEDKKCKTTLW